MSVEATSSAPWRREPRPRLLSLARLLPQPVETIDVQASMLRQVRPPRLTPARDCPVHDSPQELAGFVSASGPLQEGAQPDVGGMASRKSTDRGAVRVGRGNERALALMQGSDEEETEIAGCRIFRSGCLLEQCER